MFWFCYVTDTTQGFYFLQRLIKYEDIKCQDVCVIDIQMSKPFLCRHYEP